MISAVSSRRSGHGIGDVALSPGADVVQALTVGRVVAGELAALVGVDALGGDAQFVDADGAEDAVLVVDAAGGRGLCGHGF